MIKTSKRAEIANTVTITIDHGAFRNKPRMIVNCNLTGRNPTTDVEIYDNDNEAFIAASVIRNIFELNGVNIKFKFS